MRKEIDIKRKIREIKEEHLQLQDIPRFAFKLYDLKDVIFSLENKIDALEWVLKNGDL